MKLTKSFVVLLLASMHFGCEGKLEEEPIDEPGDKTGTECAHDAECDNGIYCDGTEYCQNGYCETTGAPSCDDGIECTTDSCSHVQNGCVFSPPDADGDGHFDASCLDPADNSLGDDCDDADADRYPGNTERCEELAPTHDEDCDPESIGFLDVDEDGSVSAACCNEDEAGEPLCGEDCDDTEFRKSPEYPEICDDIDNDCDGKVDVNTKEVLWYTDVDQDHYGDPGAEGVLSCAPIPGASLTPLDCNDGAAAIHVSAVEVCDGFDNNCDGNVDENDVCRCGLEGTVQACACGADTLTPGVGIQTCSQGTWATCDCSECVEGQAECSAGIIPRRCENGRWQIKTACSGTFPLCSEGACVCADGSLDCSAVVDIVPPRLVASVPNAKVPTLPTSAIVSAAFSETLAAASISSSTVQLKTTLGTLIPGTISFSDKTISFTPAAPLGEARYYQFVIDGVTDASGNVMDEPVDLLFATPVSRSRTLLADDEFRLDVEQVAASAGGTVALIATKLDRDTFSDFGRGVYVWNGFDFVLAEALPNNYGTTKLDVDDYGRILVLQDEIPGIGTRLSEKVNASWTYTDVGPPTAAFDSDLDCNREGACVVAGGYGSTLWVQRRTSGGDWLAPHQVNEVLGNRRMTAKINEAGDVAISYPGQATNWLLHTNSLGEFSAPLTAGSHYDYYSTLGLSSNGTAILGWTKPTVLPNGSFSNNHVHAAIRPREGEWLFEPGSLSEPDLSRSQSQLVVTDGPESTFLSFWDDNVELVGTFSDQVVGSVWTSTSGWSAPFPVSAVSFDGGAYGLQSWHRGDSTHLVWRVPNHQKQYDLWHSAYSLSTGMSEPSILENDSRSVEDIRVVTTNDATWVFYESNGLWGWFHL